MQMAMFEGGADRRVGARLTGYEPKSIPKVNGESSRPRRELQRVEGEKEIERQESWMAEWMAGELGIPQQDDWEEEGGGQVCEWAKLGGRAWAWEEREWQPKLFRYCTARGTGGKAHPG